MLAWFIWRVIGVLRGYISYRFYRDQGVVFISGGYNLFGDIKRLVGSWEKHPNALSWLKIQKDALKTEELPPVVGVTLLGTPLLHVTSVDMLQDLYVNRNAVCTKHFMTRWQFWALMPQSIVF